MNCKQIQELILTDYLDSETASEQSREVTSHLAGCQTCREFESAVKDTAFEPFQDADRVTPPACLWDQIKSTIEAQHADNIFGRLYEYGRELFRMRPMVSLATAAIVLLVIVSVTQYMLITGSDKTQEVVRIHLEEQVMYFTYLDSDETINFGTDLDMPIDEYFL